MSSSKYFVVGLACFTAFAQWGCGKSAEDELAASNAATGGEESSTHVSADDPGTVITSEGLQRLKGRWVKEIPDPMAPNPPMLRIRGSGQNVLSGRLLASGAFADVGVGITIVDDSENNITMTLVDDETRPHPWVPKERIFKGKWDPEKLELTVRSGDGEFMTWEFSHDNAYEAQFTGNLFRCVVVPTPLPSPSPGGTTTTPSPTTPAPGGGEPVPPTGNLGRVRTLPIPVSRLEANPAPSPSPEPRANLTTCGVMSSYKDKWSRWSGSE
jgi:hypothetical protein